MKKLILIMVILLAVTTTVSADGIFQKCTYLNDCKTFATEKPVVKNYKNGIAIEMTIPDADLSTTGNPLEVIVTTGDVYTKCSNTDGIKEITGDVLYRGNVVPGLFTAYIPLEEGTHNITVYIGQSVCANCPQAWVIPITVEHKENCDWGYKLYGNFPCYLDRNDIVGDVRNKLPIRYDNTEYMYDLCRLKDRVDCDGNPIPDVGFDWIGKWTTYCLPLPKCTACQ